MSEERNSQKIAERAVKLRRQLAEAELEVKRIKAELETILLAIPRIFTSEKIRNIPYDGATVHYRRDIQLSKRQDVETIDLIRALRSNGLADFVNDTYNWKGLQSLLVEHDRQLKEEGYVGDWKEGILKKFPKEVFELLNVHEQFKGRITNA